MKIMEQPDLSTHDFQTNSLDRQSHTVPIMVEQQLSESFVHFDESSVTPELTYPRYNVSPNVSLTSPKSVDLETQLPVIIKTASLAQKTINEALSTSKSEVTKEGGTDTDLGEQLHTVQLQKYICVAGLCRICLLVKDNLSPIFQDSTSKNSSNKFQLQVAIKFLLDIEVKPNDGLSSSICVECLDNLVNFGVFRKNIALGQSKLTQIIEQVGDSNVPTFIPSLGVSDIENANIYKHPKAIMTATKLLRTSQYSHCVLRNLSDRTWDEIFTHMAGIAGVKSGKLQELAHFVLERPYVLGFFCDTCKTTIHGSLDDFMKHQCEFHGVACSNDVLCHCDICGNSFRVTEDSGKSSSRNYTEHWLQHFFLHECHACHIRLPSSRALWVHNKSAHDRCETLRQTELIIIENEKMSSKSKKLRHKVGEKIHTCSTCSKQFSTRNGLRSHLVKHETIGSFTCEVCGKLFKRLGNLQEHRRMHTNEKPFTCSECQRTFRMQPNYFKHLKIHQRSK